MLEIVYSHNVGILSIDAQLGVKIVQEAHNQKIRDRYETLIFVNNALGGDQIDINEFLFGTETVNEDPKQDEKIKLILGACDAIALSASKGV